MRIRGTTRLTALAVSTLAVGGIAVSTAGPALADRQHDTVGQVRAPGRGSATAHSSTQQAGAPAGRVTPVRVTPAPPQPPAPLPPSEPTTAGVDPRCKITGLALCANKTLRTLFVVKNGVVLSRFDARFGRPGYDTPEGVYSVYAKVANEWSWRYNARMPWTLYFLRGYAVHYSSTFASIGWAPPGGSHGCVNLRDWAGAQWLFNTASIGTRVVVYR